MNYAVVVLGFVLVFCIVYYFIPGFGGKTFFTGPVRTIDEIVDENPMVRQEIEREIVEERKTEGSTEKELVEISS
jgi:hypothetical protein